MMKKVAGFTMIELLIVLAILATLLTIAAPRYFSSVDRAKESALRQNLFVLRDAIDKFHSDNGEYPEELAVLVDKRYIRFIPEDPFTRTTDSWILIRPAGADTDSKEIYDIKSGATGTSTKGDPYGNW
ncbi:MAG: type II secretion system protein [Limnobacter sp.]|uniref:type II secretion system protein n=1 Tax=Limnobacter sp. TaxID=2003368 RepID=UPI003918C0C5